MALLNQFLSRSALTPRILIPTNLISIIALSMLGYTMVRNNADSLQGVLDSKMEFTAGFLQHSSAESLARQNVAALEGFVRETERDQDVAFAVFADANGKELTKGTKERPKDESRLQLVARGLKDVDGKLLGSFRIGYTKTRLGEALKTTFWIVLLSVFSVQLILSITLMMIMRSVNKTTRLVLDRLGDATNTISATSDELSSNSDQLSKGVTKQASAIQETVASMSEMSSMLAQTASSARGCHSLAGKVAEKTRSGTETMEQLVSAMGSIETANSQLHDMVTIIRDISNKTQIINDIVFKTQLLSLNASIEAARAGQHGRGFAVVAEEVGNLATVSGSSAKEISELLESSMRDVARIVANNEQRVKEGRAVSDEALKTFNEIASDVAAISRQIQQINEAAREQEQGVKQSSNAMVLVDETTHTNSSVAKQAYNSSRLLAEQSRRIAQITLAIRQVILGRGAAEDKGASRGDAIFADDPRHGSGDAAALADRIVQRAQSPQLSLVEGGEDVNADDESFQRQKRTLKN